MKKEGEKGFYNLHYTKTSNFWEELFSSLDVRDWLSNYRENVIFSRNWDRTCDNYV